MPDDTGMDSLEYCGLDGDGHAAPTRHEINRFVRRAMLSHIKPVKQQVAEVHKALYDPDDGIIPALKTLKAFRRWICYGATWAAALVIGGLTLLQKLQETHLWPF
jgi:hypothetical protein